MIFSHLFTTSDGTHTDLYNTRGAGDPHALSDVGKHAGSCLRPKMESQAPSPETNPMWNREHQGKTPVTSRRSLGMILQPGDQIPGIHTQCGRESDDVDQSDKQRETRLLTGRNCAERPLLSNNPKKCIIGHSFKGEVDIRSWTFGDVLCSTRDHLHSVLTVPYCRSACFHAPLRVAIPPRRDLGYLTPPF